MSLALINVDSINLQYLAFDADPNNSISIGAQAAGGVDTTLIGHNAVSGDGTDNRNTVVGTFAGFGTTSGSGNSFYGYFARPLNPTDSIGVAQGYFASSATQGVCIGGFASNGGANATNVGYSSGADVQGVAIGSAATALVNGVAVGGNNPVASTDSVAIGFFSKSGTQSVIIGSNSGSLTIDNNNIVIGYQAGNALNVGGVSNTLIGYQAGNSITTATNNTIVGFQSDIPGGFSNCSAFGNGATNVAANDQIILGNAAITQIRAYVAAFTNLSDRRDKKDIEPLNAGLEFVNQLQPVRFVWNSRDGAKVGIPEVGFIAQDLLEAQQKTGITIPNLVDTTKPEQYMATPGLLVPVLTQAIKDLSAELQLAKDRISALEAR